MINSWGGYNVIANDLMTIQTTTKTLRPWYVRLYKNICTSEWAPLKKFDVVVETKPDSRVIFHDGNIIAHPDIIEQIKKAL